MPRYYEFEVALREIQPRIWRRMLLRTTASFAQLHQAIQDSFGWTESHLWEFRLPTHQGRPIVGLPVGERSAPPEDCGGTSGYARMVHYVETGEDLYDEDPDELGTWLDGWRPNGFDLARAKETFDR